ncbi:MAG: DNA-binding LacI/PurR family transcriptional regulator [Cocleimonas sp.]|jgi:DNA-binding LacI/PurR family transcriptional regulator
MSDDIPKYLIVENHIKKQIKNKSLIDKLPGERSLAKELGFSYMTIRKAIENLVNEEILYKIPTKGTYVNQNKSIRKKTSTIGYFLDSSIKSGISSPYYSLILNAIEKEAAKENYSVVYFSDTTVDRLHKTLSKLDGVIATCFPRIEDTILEIKDHIPIVVIENSAADKTIPSVIIDNFNADLESADYICGLGHTHIGFMTGLEDSDIGKSRYAGYQHGLSKNNIQNDENLVFRGNYSYEAGIEGAEYYLSLEQRPTAIICANDAMALGAMQKYKQEGFDIPEDISIVGFDDIDVASQIVPTLTTIRAPVNQIAKHSFSTLKDLIMGKQPEHQHIAIAAKLIVRESCAKLKKHKVA